MKKNRKIVLENVPVQDYAAEGKSISRIDGKVIFIENVVPGDIADIEIFKSKKDWAEAKAITIKNFSPDRVKPFCEHFGICGGCQWQMLDYEKQLAFKQKQVWDNLTRIGKIALPAMNAIIGCTEQTAYRNKLEYTFSTKQFIPESEFKKIRDNDFIVETKAACGFHAKGFFDKVVAINFCHLQAEPTNAIRNAVCEYAFKHDLSFYDIKQHAGFLRNMQVRIATTGEIMVNMIFGEENEKQRIALLDFILENFPAITTLLFTINTKMNDSMFGLEPQTYFGKGFIIEQLDEFKFKIGPKSFFQTNSRQAKKLYDVTKDFAELDGTQNIYDLYCGTGSIGIYLSKLAKKIVGVEVVKEAIDDAIENAALNNISKAEFFTGDVIEICNDSFFTKNGTPQVVITDPPRAGMHEKLVQKLLEISSPLIVYVSCNPATQARDLSLLDEKYSVEKIQPVDMFPHTHHIENVVQLKLKN